MKTLSLLFAASLSTVCVTGWASERTLEQCSIAGTAFQDGIVSDSFKIALDETRQWQTREYLELPLDLRMQVKWDIERNLPYVLTVNEHLKKSIAEWNATGLDGRALARAKLVEIWKDVGGSYAAHCVMPRYHLERVKTSNL